MSDYEVTCPICGTKFMGGWLDDCPYCDWTYAGDDDDLDDPDTCNPLTVRQARENVKKGLNIWGEPLPKR